MSVPFHILQLPIPLRCGHVRSHGNQRVKPLRQSIWINSEHSGYVSVLWYNCAKSIFWTQQATFTFWGPLVNDTIRLVLFRIAHQWAIGPKRLNSLGCLANLCYEILLSLWNFVKFRVSGSAKMKPVLESRNFVIKVSKPISGMLFEGVVNLLNALKRSNFRKVSWKVILHTIASQHSLTQPQCTRFTVLSARHQRDQIAVIPVANAP